MRLLHLYLENSTEEEIGLFFPSLGDAYSQFLRYHHRQINS